MGVTGFYHVTTGSDVMKFVKSLRFVRENGLANEINKDDLIE